MINTLLTILLLIQTEPIPPSPAGPTAMEIYVQVVSYVVTAIIFPALTWLAYQHFSLKERIRVLEKDLEDNKRGDDKIDGKLAEIETTVRSIEKHLLSLEHEIKTIKGNN